MDPNGDPISYHWVSSLSGDIGYDAVVESTLREGQHKVILWVEDDKGSRVHVAVDITVVQANRPPNVYITDPIENETFEIDEEVELNASYSNDPDGDALTLTWSSDLDGVLGQGPVVRLTTLTVGDHRITVEADDGHGHTVSVSINISIVEPVNLRPQISLTSPLSNTTVKGTVLVTGLAIDPEGEDLLVRYAFISPDDWSVASMSGSAWSFEWDTTTMENAQVAVHVEAYDGENTQRIMAQYFIDNPVPVNAPPVATMAFPPEGRIEGQVILEGTASDPDGDLIQRVEVKIDAGFWEEAVGGNAWTFWWDTATVPDGSHTVTVRAYDGQDWSDEVVYEFDVRNPSANGNGGVSGATGLVLVLIGIVVLVLALAYVRLRAPRR
jgi:hypothetical protein